MGWFALLAQAFLNSLMGSRLQTLRHCAQERHSQLSQGALMCSQGSWVVAVTTKPQCPHGKKVPADNGAGFWWPLNRGCIWYLSALEGGTCAFSQPVPLRPSGWCE